MHDLTDHLTQAVACWGERTLHATASSYPNRTVEVGDQMPSSRITRCRSTLLAVEAVFTNSFKRWWRRGDGIVNADATNDCRYIVGAVSPFVVTRTRTREIPLLFPFHAPFSFSLSILRSTPPTPSPPPPTPAQLASPTSIQAAGSAPPYSTSVMHTLSPPLWAREMYTPVAC